MGLFSHKRKSERGVAVKDKNTHNLFLQAYPSRQHAQVRGIVNADSQPLSLQAIPDTDAQSSLVKFGEHGNVVTFDAFAVRTTVVEPTSIVKSQGTSYEQKVEPGYASSAFHLSTDGIGIPSTNVETTSDDSDEDDDKSIASTSTIVPNKKILSEPIKNVRDIAEDSRSCHDSIPKPILFRDSESSLEMIAQSKILARKSPAICCEQESIAKELYTKTKCPSRPAPLARVSGLRGSKSTSGTNRKMRWSCDSSDSVPTNSWKAPIDQIKTVNSSSSSKSHFEAHVQKLQDHYNKLNLEYHKLTADQQEIKGILIDVKSDLCSTNLTTTQNSVEIADLQDAQRTLTSELSTLKETVNQCQSDLFDIKRERAYGCSSPELDATRKDEPLVATKTTLDVSQKAQVRRMSLNEYKHHCAAQYRESLVNKNPPAQPPGIKSCSDADSMCSESDEDDVASLGIDVLAKTRTAKPLLLMDDPVKSGQRQTNPSTNSVQRSGAVVPKSAAMSQKPDLQSLLLEKTKSKADRKMPNEVFKSLARDKLSSIGYFRKHGKHKDQLK